MVQCFNLKYHLSTAIILLLVCNASSQSIGLELMAGKIWKHKKALEYETPDFTPAIQLNYFRPLKGNSEWNKPWNHPQVGLSMMYLSFGDMEVLGQAFAIFPNAHFNVKTFKSFQIEVHCGFGLAWLNKTFKASSNRTNNAIGSKLNNITKIGIGLNKIYPSWEIGLNLNLTHFSNGGAQSPNSGINVISSSIQFKKLLNMRSSTYDKSELTEQEPIYERSGFLLDYTIGITEDEIVNGPKYLVNVYSVSWYKRFSNIYRLILGLEYEYNSAKYHFGKNVFQDEANASKSAKQIFPIIANEFFLADFSVRFQTGFYTSYPSSLPNQGLYFKLISNYHFNVPKNRFLNSISIGVVMKSHYANAEYIGLILGLDI